MLAAVSVAAQALVTNAGAAVVGSGANNALGGSTSLWNSLTAVTAAQVEYDAAISLPNGYFFVSDTTVKSVEEEYIGWNDEVQTRTVEYLSVSPDASLTMVDDYGNAVKIMNTVGFDRMYKVVSGYGLVHMDDPLTESNSPFIIVGTPDGKYSALNDKGEFIGNGALYDQLTYFGDYLIATTADGRTYYDEDFKEVLSLSSDKLDGLGELSDYYTEEGLFVFSKKIDDSDGYNITVIDENADTVLAVQSRYWFDNISFVTGNDGNVYMRWYHVVEVPVNDFEVTLEEQYDFYNLDGTEYTGNAFEEASAVERSMTVESEGAEGYVYFKGARIYSFKRAFITVGKAEIGMDHVFVGDKLVIASPDGLAVFNTETGEKISENKDVVFAGIDSVSYDAETVVLMHGESIGVAEWGNAMNVTGYRLYDINGNALSEVYSNIECVEESRAYDFIYGYESGLSFSVQNDELYGLISSQGRVLLAPTYGSVYYLDRTVAAYFTDSDVSGMVDLYDSRTGKCLYEDVVLPNDNVIEVEWGESYSFVQKKGRYYCIIVSDESHSKLGLIVIK